MAKFLDDASVRRACGRAALRDYLDAKRGLSTLASIAATAPLVGFLATTLMIPCCFPGFGTDRSTILGVVTGLLAASLLPSAFGVLVGVLCRWIYGYLRGEAESLHFEAVNVDRFIAQYGGASSLMANKR